jgi:subtilisin family serine protease
MASHARRGRSALRPELLEARALLTGGAAAAGLLIGFVPGTTAAAVQADLDAAGAHLVQSFPDGTSLVAANPGVDSTMVQAQLARNPAVKFADPNATVQTQGLIPNDPDFKLQWGLKDATNTSIDAPQAWAQTTGSSAIIVAVLDTGIDLTNPEFAGRLWTNPDTSGSDGYPGDVHGWNFVDGNADIQDDNGHGTHVSGILAATGNNGIGVAGVAWNAQLMPLKVLDANGDGNDAEIVSAIDFAVQHGARVINASWGGGPPSQAVANAISYAGSQGAVFVTAAGNNGTNIDNTPFYPASYHLPNEIAVAAVNQAGSLAGFSDFGARTVALAAPGVNIVSTVPGGYAFESGTSMAAPYVSGVVALVAGLYPSVTAARLVQQVLSTTKPLPALAGKTTTGGIVDAARAVGIPHATTSVLRVHTASRSPRTSVVPHGPAALTIRPHHHHELPHNMAEGRFRLHGQPHQAGSPNSWV